MSKYMTDKPDENQVFYLIVLLFLYPFLKNLVAVVSKNTHDAEKKRLRINATTKNNPPSESEKD